VTGQASVLFDERQLVRRVAELGRQIAADYAGRTPVLVSVLKGAAVFLADLIRAVDLPLAVDFMSVSTYAGEPDAGDHEAGSGVVRILKDLDQDIGGRDVLVVEDIIDTGLTLSYLLTTLRARRPASLEVCALLDRTVRRIPTLEVRYRGFEIPDVFVVGYGLDQDERFRNLPYIVAVDRQATLEEHPELLLPFGVGGIRTGDGPDRSVPSAG
jgi:hypoxanthine phosphoribosyltransferase